MNKNPDNIRMKIHSGFSLIDVLVGMVIALLGTIIIFQVFSVSEGIKRTSTSGGDAQQNGSMAMFTLENSLMQAGYGFFPPGSPWLWALPADPANPVPVTINQNAPNTSDSISLMYRQNWDYGSFAPVSGVAAAGINVISPQALTTETITVQTHCIVNGVDNGSVLPQLCSSINGVISDGIVLMKAQLNGNSVNVALVARSTQPEDKDALGNRVQGNACATTTAAPFVSFTTIDLSLGVGLAATDSWKCYRYKTYENTVALRNVIWKPM